jgi:hypothetical protein
MGNTYGGSAEFDAASAGEWQRRTRQRTATPEPALPQPFQGAAAIARACTARPQTGEVQRTPPTGLAAFPICRASRTGDSESPRKMQGSKGESRSRDSSPASPRAVAGAGDGSHAAARQSGFTRPPRSGPPVRPNVTLPLREPTPSDPAGGSSQRPPRGPRAPPQPGPLRWTGPPLPDSGSREEPLEAQSLGAGPSGAGPPRTGSPRTGSPRTGSLRTGSPRTGSPRTGPPRTGPPRTGPSGSPPLRAASSGAGRSAACTPGSAGCRIRLGIETEFLIAAIMQPDALREDLSKFVKDLAKKHNADVDPSHPRMLEHLRGPNEQADFTRWAMTLGETVTRRSWKSCKPFPMDIFISQK